MKTHPISGKVTANEANGTQLWETHGRDGEREAHAPAFAAAASFS